MADRTVNININYKINTDDLQKVQSISAQAQKATDALGASAAKAGADSSRSFTQFGSTLEGLTLKMQQLKGQIALTKFDDPKLPGLINQYKQLKTAVDDANKKLLSTKDAAKAASEGSQGLATQLGNVYSAVKLILTAGLVKELVDMSINLAKTAGNAEGVERAFKRAFPASTLILNDLRKATRNTVTDFELMQRTLQATNLGVNVEKLPTLFAFAAARAQQTGESVDYLVDSIVRGIGRKSILVLDNLGLSATRLKAEFGGAALASQSVGDVTNAVSKIAQEELDKMGGYAETAATKVDQLSASWQGLGLEIAKAATQKGGLIDFFKQYVDKGKDIVEAYNKNISVSELYHQRLVQEAAITGINIIKQKEFTDDKENNLRVTKEIIAEKTHDLILTQEQIKLLEQQRLITFRTKNPFSTSEGAAILKQQDESLKNLRSQKDVYTAQILLLKDLQKQLDITDTKEEEDASGIVSRKKEEIKLLQEQIDLTNKLGDLGESGRLIKAQKKAQEELDVLLGKSKKKKKEDANEVQQYLAYLSDLELFQTKSMLKDRYAARKAESEEEQKLAKEETERKSDEVDKQFEYEKKYAEMIVQLKKHLADESIGILQDQANSIVQSDTDQFNSRIRETEKFYSEQIKLAGNNDKAKEKLEIERQNKLDRLNKEAFDRDKRNKKIQAIINGAAAAARAFVDYEYPVSLAIAALAAAQVASQVAIIDRQKFAKGVIDLKGPGTGTSDSIPAMLSAGESVMTAKETFKAKGVLEMVRANKLDDNILKQLQLSNEGVRYVAPSDKNIVDAINRNKPTEFVKKWNDIYDVKIYKDGSKKLIRSKSMGNG